MYNAASSRGGVSARPRVAPRASAASGRKRTTIIHYANVMICYLSYHAIMYHSIICYVSLHYILLYYIRQYQSSVGNPRARTSSGQEPRRCAGVNRRTLQRSECHKTPSWACRFRMWVLI